jgi:hypothetical protein
MLLAVMFVAARLLLQFEAELFVPDGSTSEGDRGQRQT